MNLVLWLYAIDVVGNLGWFFKFILVILMFLMIGFILTSMVMADVSASDLSWKTWRIGFFSVLLSSVPVLFCYLAIPTQKTLYLMLGAKTSQEILANPKIQETGGKVLELINKKLDEMTTESPKDTK